MVNEKRLIDANALADKVDESKYNNPHPQGMVRVNHRNEHDHFLRMILDAPTVDAVEVVHGHWEYGKWENGHWVKGNERCRCSVCHRDFEVDNLNIWNGCPHCLAKMDGDLK